MKTYILRDPKTVEPQKPPRPLPPRQPLPTAVLHPNRPALQLGLDVHLEFIMAVVQRGHASLQAKPIVLLHCPVV